METVDAGAVWDLLPSHDGRRKAYFFFGSRYTRFDVESGVEDYGYPQLISTNWEGIWTDRIDAVIVWPVKVDRRRKAYFFRGAHYIRWDVKGDHSDYIKTIADNWKNWPPNWNRVDAAVHFPGDSPGCQSSEGIVYFFCGSEYARFNVDQDQFVGDPQPISKGWPGLRDSGIDAAVGWPLSSAMSDPNKAYFFWGKQYFRYDLSREAPDGGYPRKIAEQWRAREVCIWAASDVPIAVHEDARLREADKKTLSKLQWPEGLSRGQAGWHIGVNWVTFDSLLQLLNNLKLPDYLGAGRLRSGEITRLAINAHGLPGDIRINGRSNKAGRLTAAALVPEWSDVRNQCLSLEKLLAPDATVLFMGCLAGFGSEGSALLKALSNLWPGRTVVMFWSIGYQLSAAMLRDSNLCEAGMRDTRQVNLSVTVPGKAMNDFEEEMRLSWDDFKKLPWASHVSQTSRVAKNGQIIADTLPADFR